MQRSSGFISVSWKLETKYLGNFVSVSLEGPIAVLSGMSVVHGGTSNDYSLASQACIEYGGENNFWDSVLERLDKDDVASIASLNSQDTVATSTIQAQSHVNYEFASATVEEILGNLFDSESDDEDYEDYYSFDSDDLEGYIWL
ncbi:hypothetical protein CFIMG_007498RA00001 [Ceratocystis fimbriata CBS 114723]|uniref:Uncharacterized protein n=1 Tax=Ceratocystis fimbriata CBS 114723 TaxID=1035309 RepID=A0A2C5WAS0_9PEZI|nr:hypothetical protein CFIMG_007498RA00001 [Ceratocystis fimbriata CBS 114723]